MMNRRKFVVIAGGGLLPLLLTRRAQSQAAVRRIGLLSTFSRAGVEDSINRLRPELEKLGWTNGQNIVILEPRTSEARNERLPALAAELLAQSPDVILAQTAPATRALMQATKTVPIVMDAVGNPVEYGLVADLRKPGGNVTGSSYLMEESAHKLLHLLKEAAPRVRSVAVFVNPTHEAAASFAKQMRAEAEVVGMRVQVLEVSGPGDFEPAFNVIRSENTESILLAPEPLVLSKRDAIAAFAQRQGLPLAVVGERNLPAGGLIAYGPSRDQYPQLAARYVDRILKGGKPADLPVEQPTKFDLVINMKAAKTLGLTIPQSLLVRADELVQ
jgi:putative ABC transport system substrate-binding protein